MKSIELYVIQQIVLIIIQLALTSLIVVIHRLTPSVNRWIDRHTTNTERQILMQIGGEAVAYAKHTFSSQDGQTQLNGAVNYALSVLKLKGLEITPDEVVAAIKFATNDGQPSQS